MLAELAAHAADGASAPRVDGFDEPTLAADLKGVADV